MNFGARIGMKLLLPSNGRAKPIHTKLSVRSRSSNYSSLLKNNNILTPYCRAGVAHDIRHLAPFPLYVERSSGVHKTDADGHTLIDLWMGHGAIGSYTVRAAHFGLQAR